ncbi:MAG: histidine phosphatase family protein [Halieaceae bacterium]|jgi:phosphohistidine phosphatase|nr:histidine phosphatase family protein [Halieaceae bacterium]
MRVYVVRHGDAAPPPGGGERALTDHGFQDSHDAGRLLATEGFDFLLYSPKLRTRQTRDCILSVAGDIASREELSLLPPTTEQSVVDSIEACGGESVVLVSHLPLVAELVGWFTTGDPRDYRLMGFPPAGIVALDMDVAGQGMASQAWHAFPPEFVKQ